MPEQADRQIINPNTLTYDGDTFPGDGVTLRYTINPPRRIPIRREGELSPSGYETVPTDQPGVTFTVESSSEALLHELQAKTQGGPFVAGVDEAGGAGRTLTFANTFFNGGTGSINRTAVGRYSTPGIATSVTPASA